MPCASGADMGADMGADIGLTYRVAKDVWLMTAHCNVPHAHMLFSNDCNTSYSTMMC